MPAKLVETWLTRDFTAIAGSANRLRAVTRWTMLKTVQRLDGNDTLDGALPRTFPAEDVLPQTQVIQLRREDGRVEEWPLLGWSRDKPTGLITVSAAPARVLLSRRALIVVDAGTDVLVDAIADGLTPAEIIDTCILPRCPSCVVRGTVDPTDIVPTWTASAQNGLAACLSLADAINTARYSPAIALCYFSLERVDDATWAICYRRTASDTPITLTLEKNLGNYQQAEDRTPRITQYLPYDATTKATTALCWFRVASLSGTTVGLESWDAYPGTPIGFDDQLNGDYLVGVDGTTTWQITGSNASTQQVTVTSASGISLGDVVGLARDASGNRKVVWTDPDNDFTSADFLAVPDASPRINWVKNARFDHWSAGIPVGWSRAGISGVGAISQITPTTDPIGGTGTSALRMDGTGGSSDTTLFEATWPMPSTYRNRVWSVRARVYCPDTGYLATLYISTSRGWTAQGFALNPSGTSPWNWIILTVDESAAGAGAWTGGVRLGNSNVSSQLEWSRCEFVEGDATDSIDVTYGLGPNRLIELVNLQLGQTRDSAQNYTMTVLDRARQSLARYPNDVLLPGRRVRPLIGTVVPALTGLLTTEGGSDLTTEGSVDLEVESPATTPMVDTVLDLLEVSTDEIGRATTITVQSETATLTTQLG